MRRMYAVPSKPPTPLELELYGRLRELLDAVIVCPKLKLKDMQNERGAARALLQRCESFGMRPNDNSPAKSAE